jgi:2-polyprenyl-3-methyl-5-hydroxy-6-metoxy-1,4-benzoquinol methylase
MQTLKNRSAQKKVIESFFNRTSERWDNLYSGEAFINQHMRERKKTVLDLVEEYSNGRKLKILDLGCGSGILTKELINKGHTVAGADIAEDMIAILNNSLNYDGGKKYMGSAICDAEALSFVKETFDVVLCVGLLQYQLRDDKILGEIARALSKDGICIATFPNLLRINYLFDPFYYFKFIYRLAKKGFYKLKRFKSNSKAETVRLTGTFQNSYPYDKKYYFSSIKKILSENKFDMTKVVSFGYGPFTVFDKQIFSDKLSFSISMAIDRLASESKLNLFNYIGNRWVCVAKKK